MLLISFLYLEINSYSDYVFFIELVKKIIDYINSLELGFFLLRYLPTK